MHVEHAQLGVGGGVADGDAGHEAVPLRLREGVGALHLDRVLGGDHHERARQRVTVAVHGDLALLHRLQQRRLGLGGGAVDLVADDDLREDRPGLELELGLLLVVDAHAGDVRGQQVRGELDAADRAVHRSRQCLGQHRLADPGHVLDEEVALGQQDGQREPYDLRLALDHPLDRPAHPFRCGGQICEARSPVIGRHPALLGPLSGRCATARPDPPRSVGSAYGRGPSRDASCAFLLPPRACVTRIRATGANSRGIAAFRRGGSG